MSRSASIPRTVLTRVGLFGLALLASAAAAPNAAQAGSITISANASPYFEWVPLVGGALGGTITPQYAAQLVQTINPGATYNAATSFTAYAWCIDFFHGIGPTGDLDGTGTGVSTTVYTMGALTDDHSGTNAASSNPVSATIAREIAALATYGNQQMAIAPSNTLSAAVQAAIWSLEYGAHYDYTGFNWTFYNGGVVDTAIAPLIDSLLALAPGLPTGSETLYQSFLPDGTTYNLQALLIEVPEPSAIALPGIALSGIALAVLVSTRRQRNGASRRG